MIREEIATYEKAVEYLLGIPRFTSKNTPEDTRAYLHRLGDPDRGLHIVHIAGTNGKGSVCAYLRSILEAAGKRVAVFTSPHLVDIRERFVIDGRMADREEFLRAFLKVYEGLDWESLGKGGGYHPTFFEFLFFMAMLMFARVKTDYCILETGLGGRLDATNSVSCKELCVITRIGFDHMQYLGNTISAIAGEKAGIMTAGVPVVYSDTVPEASEVFVRRAVELGCPLTPVSKNDYELLKIYNKNIDFSLQSRYYGCIDLSLATIAAYQVENSALAVRAAETLDEGREITAAHIREGLENCLWPGRMEEILPEVYLDGAHNEDGIRAFLDTVRRDGFDGRRRLLFSAVKDKDYRRMLEELLEEKLFSFIAIAPLRADRAASMENMERVMERYPDCAYAACGDTGAALQELLAGRRDGERIYIAGSLYLAGEIKELVNHDKF